MTGRRVTMRVFLQKMLDTGLTVRFHVSSVRTKKTVFIDYHTLCECLVLCFGMRTTMEISPGLYCVFILNCI